MNTATTTGEIVICAIPFASPHGSFTTGEHVRGDHPAVKLAPKYFVEQGTPHSEWPTAWDAVVEHNEQAERDAREAADREFAAEAAPNRVKFPEPKVVTAKADFTARYLGRPTTIARGSKVLSDHELVESYPGQWK